MLFGHVVDVNRLGLLQKVLFEVEGRIAETDDLEFRLALVDPAIGERDAPNAFLLGKRDAHGADGVITLLLGSGALRECLRTDIPAKPAGKE